MAASMADHLLSQEYSRVRSSSSAVLTEPLASGEGALRLAEAYERYDASPEEYLALVTAQRPFSPASAPHAVTIETGTYCASTALPVIVKSFLLDHGNAVVKKALDEFGVPMLEKTPSGEILLRLRSLDLVQQLAGQEVVVLGRKFKVKRPSVFMNKFYLDVAGVHSTEEANTLFLGLCALGARPFFMTPRDVNLETQVATPTWRFYFGRDTAPSCLVVHGYVTNQFVCGSKFYLVRGKRSTAPPAKASSYRRARYAVELPAARSYPPEAPHDSSAVRTMSSSASLRTPVADTHDRVVQVAASSLTLANVGTDTEALRRAEPLDAETGGLAEEHQALHDRSAMVIDGTPTVSSLEINLDAPTMLTTPASPMDWSVDGDSEAGDVDMIRQMETGFKRTGPSFADGNPFGVLDSMDCDFEAIQPDIPANIAPGIVVVPHLRAVKVANAAGPLPTKKRSPDLSQRLQDDALLLEEALKVSEKEAEMLAREDHVRANVDHLDTVKHLLQTSKNMDRIVQSMTELPLAWSIAFCEDLSNTGHATAELADIHLWNRILAAYVDGGVVRSFHDRMSTLKLHAGNTRDRYVSYMASVYAALPSDVQAQWKLLRCLSAFELLVLGACPFIYQTPAWLQAVVEEPDVTLPHNHVNLLSDRMLLKLLRSSIGKQVLQAAQTVARSSDIINALNTLRTSEITVESVPTLSVNVLMTTPTTAGTDN